MKQRIITGLLIAFVVLATFIAGGLLRYLVISAFILVGVYETYAIKEKEWPKWLFILLIGFVLGLSQVSDQFLFISLLGLIMFFYLISILNPWFSPTDLGYIITMILIFTGTLKSILMVFDQFGINMMIFLLVCTYLTDTGAYFSGFYFGKTKLNERISPKKTVEGSIGGWLFGSIGGFIFAYFMVEGFDIGILILMSIIFPIIGQIGDLAFSDIKRHFKIKDFGSIFPAHGGVLDRIDSLVFNLLFFYIFMTLLFQVF
jgi:phosphatidate cytidylyltransferase